MRLHQFCFIFSVTCVILGMALGIWMGISEDHSLAPTHAHLNLIGWVSMAIFGLYHRGTGRPTNVLDRVQVGFAAIGTPAFVAGLAVYLMTDNATVEAMMFPIALTGTMLCLGSMLLFLVVVIRDALQEQKPAIRSGLPA